MIKTIVSFQMYVNVVGLPVYLTIKRYDEVIKSYVGKKIVTRVTHEING